MPAIRSGHFTSRKLPKRNGPQKIFYIIVMVSEVYTNIKTYQIVLAKYYIVKYVSYIVC